MNDLGTQLKLIKKGAVELISENELVKKLQENRPLRIKFGVDPTTADIHLGHTVALTKLRQFQELGHKVVFLIGDFTAQIGDPSGRSETRKPLTAEEVARNAETYLQQVFKILDKDPARLEVVYNSHWLGKMGVKEIISLASRYTVARMLERDDFQKRYKEGTPISILEFLYPLMQGFDSVQIDADVEIGGSDQKFNLLVGRELMRDYGKKSAQVVLTMPLLEGLDGVRKMSKSYNNYIGITEPPKEIFGKIMSVSDELMYRYYELLTNEEVAEIKKQHPMEAKKKLGEIMVERFYGHTAAGLARTEFENVFKANQLPDYVETIYIGKDTCNIIDVIVESKLAESKREAKRMVEQGGVKIDAEKVTDVNYEVDINKEPIIQIGKRKFKKIKNEGVVI
ncbi:MAG: tyrosine--tRNA ligase [bacterium]|nr:tyrosine--tRNA ligase [bacterium]MDD5757267.1 tyrosine--tRNA ligase [bacterium]